MAIVAYVLIEVAVGKTDAVLEGVRKLEGVTAAHGVTGPYDVIAVAEVADTAALARLVTGGIHPIPGVLKTTTCLGILG